ncbi:hypothetical protein TTHERM_000043889 (macronuclear) [Tetrahymena thermophila SB210]|uniref:Uncharacterized protein n=1 Tax=Tetrahymena thermophila (strain SB210) TaxID=312017 RepID=W7XB84_TETTS|nr:hypothetical protein TTHERM_000043889 [Tetrahymena thermophila SB210]EWS74597.1 hypothetical protein TTHERM_000043889 [Tetrahymena thermophila SB210]|eukprot:XP_012652819.1 hypothetical protein TTHERM_000043889 [Tetrahymena thermophila SB210]
MKIYYFNTIANTITRRIKIISLNQTQTIFFQINQFQRHSKALLILLLNSSYFYQLINSSKQIFKKSIPYNFKFNKYTKQNLNKRIINLKHNKLIKFKLQKKQNKKYSIHKNKHIQINVSQIAYQINYLILIFIIQNQDF